MKTGIFGGTFNPVHHGHLINAQRVLEDFSLDQIVFIPAQYPVHKDGTDIADPADRLAMVRAAIRGNDRFSVSDIEIAREEPSYTIVTVRRLVADFPERSWQLIIGADEYGKFHTWRSYRDLMGLVSLIVMARPGAVVKNPYLAAFSERISIAGNPEIDISSSDIRQRIRAGRSILYLVPPAVEEYIMDKGLFRQ